MLVPEAAVNENCLMPRSQNNVGTAREIGGVKLIFMPEARDKSAYL